MVGASTPFPRKWDTSPALRHQVPGSSGCPDPKSGYDPSHRDRTKAFSKSKYKEKGEKYFRSKGKDLSRRCGTRLAMHLQTAKTAALALRRRPDPRLSKQERRPRPRFAGSSSLTKIWLNNMMRYWRADARHTLTQHTFVLGVAQFDGMEIVLPNTPATLSPRPAMSVWALISLRAWATRALPRTVIRTIFRATLLAHVEADRESHQFSGQPRRSTNVSSTHQKHIPSAKSDIASEPSVLVFYFEYKTRSSRSPPPTAPLCATYKKSDQFCTCLLSE